MKSISPFTFSWTCLGLNKWSGKNWICIDLEVLTGNQVKMLKAEWPSYWLITDTGLCGVLKVQENLCSYLGLNRIDSTKECDLQDCQWINTLTRLRSFSSVAHMNNACELHPPTQWWHPVLITKTCVFPHCGINKKGLINYYYWNSKLSKVIVNVL